MSSSAVGIDAQTSSNTSQRPAVRVVQRLFVEQFLSSDSDGLIGDGGWSSKLNHFALHLKLYINSLRSTYQQLVVLRGA